MKVIIAGGGTGGHIFPAIAVAHALLRYDASTQLLFAGAKGKMEMEKVPLEGFKIVGLDIAGFNRTHLWKNITLPYKLLKSRMHAKRILKEFKPDVVVGVGGYASFPVLYAAQAMGIPTVVQEQNSYAGKSNKILGEKAKAICVAYSGMERFFPKDKIIITGNPVRKIIADMSRSKSEGLAKFGLDNAHKTIFITGGSQGAKSVNVAIDLNMDELMRENVQLLWQTGVHYHKQALERAEPFGNRIKVFEFIREMDYAYAAADIVVARAGALAIAELCIAAKPVIFIPYPHAAEDHQTSNAKALEDKRAAWVVKDNVATTVLIIKIKELLHDENEQQTMSANLKKLAIRDADDRIAEIIVNG